MPIGKENSNNKNVSSSSKLDIGADEMGVNPSIYYLQISAFEYLLYNSSPKISNE